MIKLLLDIHGTSMDLPGSGLVVGDEEICKYFASNDVVKFYRFSNSVVYHNADISHTQEPVVDGAIEPERYFINFGGEDEVPFFSGGDLAAAREARVQLGDKLIKDIQSLDLPDDKKKSIIEKLKMDPEKYKLVGNLIYVEQIPLMEILEEQFSDFFQ